MECEMELTVVGTSMLCCHNFAQKAKDIMLGDQEKKVVKGGRAARDPEADWNGAFYRDSKGHPAIPAHNLKSALVFAAHNDKGLAKTNVRAGILFVTGKEERDWLIINGKVRPFDKSASDVVRVGQGKTADLRWRPKWDNWSLDVKVKYDPSKISDAQLLSLFFEAGRVSGLGEGRPQLSSQGWGTFAPDLSSVRISEPKSALQDIMDSVERGKGKLKVVEMSERRKQKKSA